MDDRASLVERIFSRDLSAVRLEGGRRLQNIPRSGSRSKPLVSVITVTFNAAMYLERAIRSIVNQSYSNIEYLIIDGKSTDGTLDILRQFGDQIDYWMSEPDDGIYDAMNKGVALSKGDWVYFLGADDILVNCVHRMIRMMRQPNTIYYGDVYLPQKNKTYSGSFDWYKIAHKNINHQAIFYPRSAFQHYQYDTRYLIWADYDLNLRLWHDKRYRFQYVPELICVHNESGISGGHNDESFELVKPALIQRYFGRRLATRRAYITVYRRLRGLLRKVGK